MIIYGLLFLVILGGIGNSQQFSFDFILTEQLSLKFSNYLSNSLGFILKEGGAYISSEIFNSLDEKVFINEKKKFKIPGNYFFSLEKLKKTFHYVDIENSLTELLLQKEKKLKEISKDSVTNRNIFTNKKKNIKETYTNSGGNNKNGPESDENKKKNTWKEYLTNLFFGFNTYLISILKQLGVIGAILLFLYNSFFYMISSIPKKYIFSGIFGFFCFRFLNLPKKQKNIYEILFLLISGITLFYFTFY